MYEMGEQLERVILAGVQTYESDDTVQSLYELRELAETAGAVTVGTIMQSRETIHPATYLGKGKLEELKELLYDLDATGVICDDELSPAQLNNLEQELECKVMDRTMVILDIFAQRAKTSEGKIQSVIFIHFSQISLFTEYISSKLNAIIAIHKKSWFCVIEYYISVIINFF